jgi:hypothetical protein
MVKSQFYLDWEVFSNYGTDFPINILQRNTLVSVAGIKYSYNAITQKESGSHIVWTGSGKADFDNLVLTRSYDATDNDFAYWNKIHKEHGVTDTRYATKRNIIITILSGGAGENNPDGTNPIIAEMKKLVATGCVILGYGVDDLSSTEDAVILETLTLNVSDLNFYDTTDIVASPSMTNPNLAP